MSRKIKGKTLVKRKIKGLERENTVHRLMSQIVIVTKIHHQWTQILTMAHHQESSKDEISQDEHTPSRFSTKCSAKKNK